MIGSSSPLAFTETAGVFGYEAAILLGNLCARDFQHVWPQPF